MTRLIFGGLLLIASVSASAQRIDVNVQDERQRNSYMVGMDTVRGLKTVKDDVDIRIVAQTVIDLLVDDKKPLLTDEEFLTTRKAFVAKLQSRKSK